MIVSYFGHHIFCIENDNNIILTNPWFSKSGAYQNTWYPFPKNMHLINIIKNKLKNKKNKYVYLNSSDQDCYDKEFINSISNDVIILLSPLCDHLYDELRYKFCNIIKINEFNLEGFMYHNGLIIEMDDKKFYYLESFSDKFVKNVNIMTTIHYKIEDNEIKNNYDQTIDYINKVNPQYFVAINPPVLFYPSLYEKVIDDGYPLAYNFKNYSNMDNMLVMNCNDTIELSLDDKINLTDLDIKSYLENYKDSVNPILIRRIFDIKQQYMLSKLSSKNIFDKLYSELVNNISKFKDYNGNSLIIKLQNVDDKWIILNFEKSKVEICQGNIDMNNSILEFELYSLDQLLKNKITWKELFLTFQVECINVDDYIIKLFTMI